MDNQTREDLAQRIKDLSIHLGMKSSNVYLFGGAVRDGYLNKRPNDYDFLVQCSVDELKEKLVRMDNAGLLDAKPPMKSFYPVFSDTIRTRMDGVEYDIKAMDGRQSV